MKVALIGKGAIARYVMEAAIARGHVVTAVLVRPAAVAENPDLYVGAVRDLPKETEVVIDCAGHQALSEYGPEVLRAGTDMITVSIGALADDVVSQTLKDAAVAGHATLHLASGAIGALDSLRAAGIGALNSVTYTGRKPPKGWKGSAAERKVALDTLQTAATHFEGSARDAALEYPKNANVAAAVALASLGLDATQVRLIADPDITQNIHEVEAAGAFGQLRFEITGNALPDNPRSSALAAMSVVAKLEQLSQPISI